jgi:hypothetical protein
MPAYSFQFRKICLIRGSVLRMAKVFRILESRRVTARRFERGGRRSGRQELALGLSCAA